jgi:hypothetical protein
MAGTVRGSASAGRDRTPTVVPVAASLPTPKYTGWRTTVTTFLGETIEQPPSSAKLTTTEFYWYVEQIRAWALSLGIFIASPDEWQEAA